MQDHVHHKRHVLKIRCSDGFTRKPLDLRGHCVHEIRLPGGILFADLCAQHVPKRRRVVSKLLQMAIRHAVTVMVSLKNPEEIILIAHTHCGAAEALALDTNANIERHAAWAAKLRTQFPHITVSVRFERHSVCGTEHHGHEAITEREAA